MLNYEQFQAFIEQNYSTVCTFTDYSGWRENGVVLPHYAAQAVRGDVYFFYYPETGEWFAHTGWGEARASTFSQAYEAALQAARVNYDAFMAEQNAYR